MAKKKIEKIEEAASANKKFIVTLECPTPLAFNPYEVEAESGDVAKNKFLEVNGISASDHAFKVELVA